MTPIAPVGASGTMRGAAWWRFAGLLFERPRPGWRDEVSALAAESDDPALREAAAAARDAGEGAYLGVFGPGGTVSPREVSHRGLADPGRVLAGLAGLYAAFAYRPRAEDPADHIAVEIGFAGYLELKESYALARGNAQDAGAARRARQVFLEEHLGPFAGSLARRLEVAGPPSHLARAATRLVDRLAALGAPTADPPRAAAPRLCDDVDAEAPLSCGLECGDQGPPAMAPMPRPPAGE